MGDVYYQITVYILHASIQWNPSIAATLGEQNFGRYIGVAFIEGLFCKQIVHLGPGDSWLLYRGGLYSGALIYRIAGYFRGVYISRTANSILVCEK